MSAHDRLSPSPVAGETVREAFSKLDDEGQLFVTQMMRSQAFRECAAVRLFDEGVALAPDPGARAQLLADREEESRHYAAVVHLWSACTGRPRAELEAWATERAQGPEVPHATAWLDIAFAQWLYDRAGLFQLREAAALPFAPYARLAAAVIGDEAEHGLHGERALAALASPADSTLLGSTFTRWLRVALLSFGRPESHAARRARELGWRRREPEALQRAFLADVAPMVATLGLSWPSPEALALEIAPTTFPALAAQPRRV